MLVRRLTAAATVAVAALGVFVTSGVATAAGSKCVALVVDFSHAGGSVSSACVTVPTNGSGSDVLVAGHHKVSFDPRYGNDFVCAIDGVPAGGCHATDDTHYWVYYHRSSGSTAWRVSQEGAGTYKPANTSTDGWVYDNGSSTAPTPRDVPYSSICKKQTTTPSPSPSPTPSTSRTATPAPPRQVVATHRAVAVASTPPVATSASPSASVIASPSSHPTAAVTLAAHRHRLYRVPLGLVAGVIAAVGLGAAAIVRMRR